MLMNIMTVLLLLIVLLLSLISTIECYQRNHHHHHQRIRGDQIMMGGGPIRVDVMPKLITLTSLSNRGLIKDNNNDIIEIMNQIETTNEVHAIRHLDHLFIWDSYLIS